MPVLLLSSAFCTSFILEKYPPAFPLTIQTQIVIWLISQVTNRNKETE